MRAARVVKTEVPGQGRARLRTIVVRMQVDLLVCDAAPEPFALMLRRSMTRYRDSPAARSDFPIQPNSAVDPFARHAPVGRSWHRIRRHLLHGAAPFRDRCALDVQVHVVRAGTKGVRIIHGYSCYTTTGVKCGGPYYPSCALAWNPGGPNPARQTWPEAWRLGTNGRQAEELRGRYCSRRMATAPLRGDSNQAGARQLVAGPPWF
jgi:hypothetical protein